eukprot:scaffold1500_cov398-Prasinococcus_capsulatus_cf.AAC.15
MEAPEAEPALLRALDSMVFTLSLAVGLDLPFLSVGLYFCFLSSEPSLQGLPALVAVRGVSTRLLVVVELLETSFSVLLLPPCASPVTGETTFSFIVECESSELTCAMQYMLPSEQRQESFDVPGKP